MANPLLLADVENIFTPALVFFPQRIQNNIQVVLRMAGSTATHMKTHKTREIAQMQLDRSLALLRLAKSDGYFVTKAIAHIKQDGDFDGIRAHPKFVKFLAELDAKRE